MRNLLKQLLSFILPLTVLVIVPLIIEPTIKPAIDVLFVTGLVSIFAGLSLLAVTVSSFVRIGKGTLAPWSPTRNLVVVGAYKYVRNPMITGVLFTLIGESLIAHSINIGIWAILFFVSNTAYFILSEEPGLEARFGGDYLEYKKSVPRWVPRLTPWKPGSR